MHECGFSIACVLVPIIPCVLKIPVLVLSLANGFESKQRICLCNLVLSQQASLKYSATELNSLNLTQDSCVHFFKVILMYVDLGLGSKPVH